MRLVYTLGTFENEWSVWKSCKRSCTEVKSSSSCENFRPAKPLSVFVREFARVLQRSRIRNDKVISIVIISRLGCHYANTLSIPREQISSTDRNIFCWPKLPIKGRILDLYYFSNLIGSINWMATLKWHSRLYECYNPHLYEKYSCWSCLQVFNRKCICETSTFSVMRWSQVICSLKLIRARVSPRLIVIRMTVRRTHSKFCKRNDF